ncbi:hypothetical protein OESDEN_04065 [Oesophagostomum dentatum]|uniref:Uncharacterized protein n=1 Tax=Oesophagostomum dentatum TaxID=61180 RepID=A0A0B1TEH3_OESDE|nr:hypothetical protein OESDEN_04065 [Oesophagostomum dentatum]
MRLYFCRCTLLSDRLAILSKEPQITPCQRAKKVMEQKESEASQTENNVEVTIEVNPRRRSIPVISVSSEAAKNKEASTSRSGSLASTSYGRVSNQHSSRASTSRTSGQAQVRP